MHLKIPLALALVGIVTLLPGGIPITQATILSQSPTTCSSRHLATPSWNQATTTSVYSNEHLFAHSRLQASKTDLNAVHVLKLVPIEKKSIIAARNIVLPTTYSMGHTTGLVTTLPTQTYTWTESTVGTVTTNWEPHVTTNPDGHKYTTWISVVVTFQFSQPVNGWTVDTSGATELSPATKLPADQEMNWTGNKGNLETSMDGVFNLLLAAVPLGMLLLA